MKQKKEHGDILVFDIPQQVRRIYLALYERLAYVVKSLYQPRVIQSLKMAWKQPLVIILLSLFANLCLAHPGAGLKGNMMSNYDHSVNVKNIGLNTKIFHIDSHAFLLNLNLSPGQDTLKLSTIKQLGPKAGLIFYIKNQQDAEISMEKTTMPFDILFVGKNTRISCIFKNSTPNSNEHFSCKYPVMAIIVINAGEVDKFDLSPGLKVDGLSSTNM